MNWLSEDEINRLSEQSPKEILSYINDVLDRVFNKAVEHSLLMMPKVVTSLIRHAAVIQTTKEEFFRNNTDISINNESFLSYIPKILSEHPDWEMMKVLEEAGSLVRNRDKQMSEFDLKSFQ